MYYSLQVPGSCPKLSPQKIQSFTPACGVVFCIFLKQADPLLVIKRENVNSCWCYFVSMFSYKSSTVMERKV